MKKNIITLAYSFIFGIFSYTQQEPIFGLNETNQSYYNPSAVAVYDQHLVNTQYRNQWLGSTGSPVRYLVNYELDLDKINSGLGLVAMRDEIGNNLNHVVGLNYRYTFKLGEFSRLSAGIGLNWFHQRFTQGWVTPNSTSDPFLPPSVNSSLNLNAGLHFQRKKLNIGLAFMNTPSISVRQSTVLSYKRVLHTNLYTDYTFELSERFSLTPSLFVLTDWNKLTALLALKGLHFNRFWWLAGYRIAGKVIHAGAGIQFWKRLHIGLGYEYYHSYYYAGFRHTVEGRLSFRVGKNAKNSSNQE
jgi:type IX secretion system PorP/SprF family membrane protein